MAFPEAPAGLPSLVKKAFDHAKHVEALTYFPTEVEILHVSGIPVLQIRPLSHSY